MQFSEIMTTLRAAEAAWAIDVTEDWEQGRAIFGGLVAAIGNAALRNVVPAERPLRSLQTTFVAPASAGTWRLETQVLREGRAVTSAVCSIYCGSQLAAHVMGVYGAARSSAVRVALPPAAPGTTAEQLPVVPLPPHVPRFIHHFEMRWVEGPGLFGGQHSCTRAYLRHRDPAAPTESHVIAMTDALPPPALSLCTKPAPASTLVWSLEFLAHDCSFPAGAWWRIDHDIEAGGEGYAHQSGVLYAPDGRPLALTRQLVTVFD